MTVDAISDCPVSVQVGSRALPPADAYTGTACLAFMDATSVAAVWEDLLYDGHDHEHGNGGLMLNGAAFGTHLEHDGDFPVTLHINNDGNTVGFEVNLDPYSDDLDSLRRPYGWTAADEVGHRHSSHPDGWSIPERVTLISAFALFGDPAGLPQADNTGRLLSLDFPAAAGVLRVSVLTAAGVRRRLVAVWSPGQA